MKEGTHTWCTSPVHRLEINRSNFPKVMGYNAPAELTNRIHTIVLFRKIWSGCSSFFFLFSWYDTDRNRSSKIVHFEWLLGFNIDANEICVQSLNPVKVRWKGCSCVVTRLSSTNRLKKRNCGGVGLGDWNLVAHQKNKYKLIPGYI